VPGKSLADFKVQQYGGRPVLTRWEGTIVSPGYGRGEIVIADTSYRVLQQVTAGHGYQADLNEFLITPAGTALLPSITRSLPTSPQLVDPGVETYWKAWCRRLTSPLAPQFSSGTVCSMWVRRSPTVLSPRAAGRPSTNFHVNSIEVDTDGNLLVSARNTWTVYKIDRHSGEVMWRLGGKKSSFTMGTGTNFEWQHDARRQPDGTITLFDDAASPQKEPQSRGLLLHVDESARTASLVRQYTNYGIITTSQGNVQLLPNNNVFIGWGAEPNYTEFDAAGAIVFDARSLSDNQSYRAYRLPWTGRPTEAPSIAADRTASQVTVYVSWNVSQRWRDGRFSPVLIRSC
jgi:hypothetical protein